MTLRRLPVAVMMLAAALLAPASARAATTVSGTVAHGGGWTVMALAPNGSGSAVKASGSGAFALKLPGNGRGVTLQLIRPGGSYFGPITLAPAHKGRVAVALSGRAAKLGRIALRKGFAAVAAPHAAVASGAAVRADKHGAPVGAGHLGLVAGPAKKGKARAAAAAGGSDPDTDGIPSPMDADDDGDGTPDAVDSSTRESGAGLFSEVMVDLQHSLNANATGVTPAAIDAFVKEHLGLNFYIDGHAAGGATINSVDVDCSGLSYCRAGASSTGVISNSGNTPAELAGRVWGTVDNDGDGFPDLPANPQQPGVYSIQIRPNATTAQIAPGDTYQVHYRTPGGDIVVPTALTLYFVTTPAAATVNDQAITYPATQNTLGARANPLHVDGDTVKMDFWRPQRAAMPGEAGDLIDQGHLHYGITLHDDAMQEFGCGPGAYSALSPTLHPAGSSDNKGAALWPLLDTADDAAPDPSRKLSFTLDLGGCLRSHGIDPAGKLLNLPLTAVGEARPGGMDRAAQSIWVCLPGCTVPTDGNVGPGPGGPGPGPAGPGQSGPAAGGNMADLAITSLSATTDGGGNCSVQWTVANTGTGTSFPSVTGVHATGGAGAADASVPVQSIDAGQSQGQQTTLTGPCAGRTIQVVADSTNNVPEYHDDNNTAQQGF